MRAAAIRAALVCGATLAGVGCGGTLDAGHDGRRGLLPVDARNPVVILQDDWSGDWLGELAVLFASTGRLRVAEVVVNSTQDYWPDLAANTMGWKNLLDAARSSGLKNLPSITAATAGKVLSRPPDGQIDSTKPNNSEGAARIVSLSRELSQPFRPLVVVSGTSLTELADAYLMDATVTARVVVVAALGSYKAPNGELGVPNGDQDRWATWIVSQKYRFIQVGTYYDQTTDVTADRVANLPPNQLGNFMAKKQPRILSALSACDQVALLSVANDGFVVEAVQVSPDVSAGFDEVKGTILVPDQKGDDMVVTKIQGPLAFTELWGMLLEKSTFGS